MIIELLTCALYWTIPILLGLVTALIIYARWYYGTLENTKGLTGVVKPYFLGGSDPFFYRKIVEDEDAANVKKYGPAFGYYEGREPQIFISDPELIRLICIKDFEYFHNKRSVDFGHELVNEMIDFLPYNTWKVVRSTISPQLTTSKIRGMSYQMLEAIKDWKENLFSKIDQHDSLELIPKDAFNALSRDIIARTIFGTKVDTNDPNNAFSKNLKKLGFDGDAAEAEVGPMASVVFTLPFLMKMAPFFPPDAMDYFEDLLKNILSSRRQSKQKLDDFVDVMNDMIDKCESAEFKKLNITELTVMAQALGFLIAGFESTSATLTLLSYRLSKAPKIQAKLLEEIDTYLERHEGKIEHETIGELVYLVACINEALRMNPSLIRLDRVCQKDWFHEPLGLTIKKGTTIQIPVPAVHFDEKNFPDPNEFKPERFLVENKDKLNQYAVLSFGVGPHNCMGMRFAKEALSLSMANLLKDFRIETCADSQLKKIPGRGLFSAFLPFHLKLIKRK